MSSEIEMKYNHYRDILRDVAEPTWEKHVVDLLLEYGSYEIGPRVSEYLVNYFNALAVEKESEGLLAEILGGKHHE